MTPEFIKTDIFKLSLNPFKSFDKDWTLITAGTRESFNTMTASWGTFGILWNLPIAVCFVRPHRHTYKFTESNTYFTLSFFNEEYRGILNYCGTKSGRDTDKIKDTGLIPVESEHGNIYFAQANLAFECKKLYVDNLKESQFLIPDLISKNYPRKDFHRVYVGEIMNCYQKK